MQLYGVHGWGSAIIEAILALVQQPYTFVDVAGFDRPGTRHDRLAVVNSLIQVPALVLDDGETMTETAAIALWLAQRYPELAPVAGTAAHAQFLRMLIWLVANVYPTFTYGDYPARWAPSAQDELVAATDRYREKLYLDLEEQIVGPFARRSSDSYRLLSRRHDQLASAPRLVSRPCAKDLGRCRSHPSLAPARLRHTEQRPELGQHWAGSELTNLDTETVQ